MNAEIVNRLRDEYRDSLKNWQESPQKIQAFFADTIKDSWRKNRYVARNLPFAPDRAVICPPHSLLNFAPNQQHRTDYATGVWEGSSAEPQLDENNNIVGLNVVLHQQRLARFARSLKARGYQPAMSMEKFGQLILDAVAVHGKEVVVANDGTPSRAYIRPSVGSGVGPWGVSMAPGYFIESSVLVFRWGSYFSNNDSIDEYGVKTAITGVQRMFPITGKHASNYGAASTDGSLVRKLNYDELVYLAPYGICNGELDFNLRSFDELRSYGALSDGPGEEILALLSDGETLVYPPMRVNRLGGTVLNYLIEHLAPALGFKVCERDIILDDFRSGKIAGMVFVGNAVKVTPVGKIDIIKPAADGGEGEVIETLFESAIHPAIKKLKEQFLAELNGKRAPSHASLLTPVDLAWGDEFRTYLDEYWSKVGL
jgi:branched-subunit amino acid aminotransferase/4-amino-4-deoxychorismate lyase